MKTVTVPARAAWSSVVPEGATLTLTDLHGNQAVDFLVYDAQDTSVRYSAPDTIHAQGSIFLTTGSVLLSNEHTPLMTVTADEVGRHDTVGGACSKESNSLRYGHHTWSQHACTTKYNPARTWTAENSVGIGGAYLCVYGMEGPGGYQLVGRTTQVWSGWQQRGAFEPGSPWLLRFFDRIKWYPVDAGELLELRADIISGRFVPRIEEGTFSLADHEEFLAGNADAIAEFRTRQRTAFAAERDAWEAAGEFARAEVAIAPAGPPAEVTVPPGGRLVEAEFAASVRQLNVAPGDEVTAGQPLLALEAMKMESVVPAPVAGVVTEILAGPGDQVEAGTALLVLAPAAN